MSGTNDQSSALDLFFLKLGTVLSMTKDALLADFIGDLPSYVPPPDLAKADSLTSLFDQSEDMLSDFIEYVFRRLGYDLNNFEGSKDLYDLVKAILSTMDSLGAEVTGLASDDFSWKKEAENLVKQVQGEKGEKITVDDLFQEITVQGEKTLYSKDDGKGNFVSISVGDFGDGGKIGHIAGIIFDLFKLIRKFRDLEWSKIQTEYEDFGKFLDSTYFNQKFAERLFDHILTVLLSKAREVFDEEITEIARNIGKFQKDIEKAVKDAQGAIGKTVAEIMKEIQDLQDRINAVRALIEKEVQDLYKKVYGEVMDVYDEAKAKALGIYDQVSGELLAQYRMLRNELLALTKLSLGPFGKLGDVLDRIYHVLDFFGMIQKQTVEIARYFPAGVVDELAVPAEEIDNLINTANPLTPLTGKLDLEGLQAEAAEAAAKLKNSLPTVEIYVIRWSRLEQLFTSPKDYFQEVFPVRDYDDAEALVVKLAGLVRSFNPDIFDFSSISSILNELYVRLEKLAEEAAREGNTALANIKKKIEDVEQFLLEIKKVLEAYAVEFKKELTSAFNKVKEGAESTFDELKTNIQDAIDTVRKEALKTGRQFIADTNVKWRDFSNAVGLSDGTKEFLYELLGKPLEEIVIEKAAEYKILKGVDPSKWTDSIKSSFTNLGNDAKSIASQYASVLKDIQSRINTALDGDFWEARFKQMVSDLETEFNRQTASVPQSVNALEDFGKDSVNRLLKGEDLENPFSSFDFQAYLSIISDRIEALIPTDLDLYHRKLRDVTVAGLGTLVQNAAGISNSLEKGVDAIAAEADEKTRALLSFAKDVYAGYWPKLKDAFYKLVIRPVLTIVEKTVKAWAKELVNRIIKEVINAVKKLDVDRNAVENAVATAQSIAGAAMEVASEILMLKDEAKAVDSWQDGLKLAVKIYSLIPEEVKEFARSIITLPEINLNDLHLPDYKLDIDNKFLAVTLYELKPASATSDSGNATVSGSASIQIVAFVGDRATGETDAEGDPVVRSGLYLLPALRGELKSGFNLGQTHKLDLNASASLNAGVEKSPEDENAKTALTKGKVGMFITATKDLQFDAELLASSDAVQAYLELIFSRGQNNGDVPKLVIYESDVFSVTADNYPQKAFIGYDGGFDVGYRGEIKNLDFALDLRKMNSFFETLLNDKLEFKLDSFALGYSYKKGLDLEGSVSVRIPINKKIDLKAAKLSNLALEVALPDLRGLNFGISTNLSLDLGCVHFSLADLGFGLGSDLFDVNWHWKDFNLVPSLKLPDGIGLGIDLEGVLKGTGALKWNQETGEIVGAAELIIMDLVGASALFILNMKEKDGVKFSFMGALSVYFSPGIQLGMGFSITALGGALGLYRRIDTDRMQRAVHDGSLMSVMFVKDLDKNLDTVLENMTAYYPISKENFFVGVMAQISWAEKVKVDFGLFVQAPDPVVIMIAGGLHFNIADSLDKLLSINANFLGIIDFSKGLSFDASLYDSYIVGIQFYGDIALRIYWAGDTKGFILSAGGFHPQYTPEPGFNVSNMKRLGMKLDIGPVKLSMEEYFAVTSNTVQFGSDTRLQLGWEKFGINGFMYYNVLFQFKPFAFAFDAGIGVAVTCGSWKLMSISLALEVSGPRPWHIKGNASFWFLFVKIKCGFSYSWGKKQSSVEREVIPVFSLYAAHYKNTDDWTVISSDMVDNLVTILPYAGDELVMNSSDVLSFNQSEVPLNQTLECFGENTPNLSQITLEKVSVGSGYSYKELEEKSDNVASFAPSMFKKMTDNEKLSAPSYENMVSGFRVGSADDLKPGTKRVSDVVAKDPQIAEINMDHWKKAAAELAAQAEPEIIVTRFGFSDFMLKRAGRPRITGVTEKQSKRSYRPSQRRTPDGFARYVKTMNGMMSNNLSSLMNEPEEK